MQWLLPLLPIIYFLAKQARAHNTVAEKKLCLKEKCLCIWKMALFAPSSKTKKLTSNSRGLQDEIFRFRREPDVNWEWLYNRMQKTEVLMQESVEEFILQAQEALKEAKKAPEIKSGAFSSSRRGCGASKSQY